MGLLPCMVQCAESRPIHGVHEQWLWGPAWGHIVGSTGNSVIQSCSAVPGKVSQADSPSPPEGNGDSVENVSCDDEDEDEEEGDRGEEEDGVLTLELNRHHLAGTALRRSPV